MNRRISIGNQEFDSIREENSFYVDKTGFIKDWWESRDIVTLITRPRRFGKTLNMSMLNCFFSNKYAGRGDLFDKLCIWKDEKYRNMQGTYPVIFISFADVKQANYNDAVKQIKKIIFEVYRQHIEITTHEGIRKMYGEQYEKITPDMDDVTAQNSLKDLSNYLAMYYGKKVIILMDEYDTPIQEAYVHGYWNEFTAFLRSLFNSTFKTNPYLVRALMTGITRVSKESMFSDLNNLNVVTTTSDEYSTYFGFTEEEVFAALDEFGILDKKDDVKKWYDGFTFGEHSDIYNPWSIISYLDKKKLFPYWASTSSNGLINRILQEASPQVKENMEELLRGRTIIVNFDEQIVFNQLDTDESAIWSLLVAGGYLRVESVEYRGELLEPWYHLSITNLETRSMFANMFKGWFNASASDYNEFVRAMICGDIEAMNHYMNDVALAIFSNFDVGTHASGRAQPERFYHGFVLGLMVEQAENYEIRSNRESGFGRYDVMMIPKKKSLPAIILEFKVHNPASEKSLSDTVKKALEQIKEKKYGFELISMGIAQENIRYYGFAFEGKTVLIGS